MRQQKKNINNRKKEMEGTKRIIWITFGIGGNQDRWENIKEEEEREEEEAEKKQEGVEQQEKLK